jgi:phage terminase large subunit
MKNYQRYGIYKGGAGAGKSWWIAQKIVYNTIIHDVFNVLVIRKVGATNHDSTFSQIKKIITQTFDNWQALFQINESRGNEAVRCLHNNNKIAFKGLDDEEKIKSITFDNGDVTCIWVEEATEIQENELNQLNLRLRGVGYVPKHLILSFNPIDSSHWLKKRFFDKKQDNCYIVETTYKQNRFIDAEYKKELESYKDMDYYYYSVYCMNQWGSRSETTVFTNLKIHGFDIPEYQYQNIMAGMDFGFNHATCLYLVGFIDGELYIFKEWYAKRKTNREFIDLVKSSDTPEFPTGYHITAESAEPDRIVEWNDDCFEVYPTIKNKGSLMRGINYLKQLPAIHIHQTNCPNAVRSFQNLKYNQYKNGVIGERVVEIDDDPVAAVRYALTDFIEDKGSSHFFGRRLY